MKKVGIIGAMQTEIDLLLKEMSPKNGEKNIRETKSAHLVYYEGVLNNIPAVVVRSGIGKVNAALCAQRLIMMFGVTEIIHTGIAGAMQKGLGIFDIVVSSEAVYHDMDATGFGYKKGQIPQMDVSNFPADKNMIEAVQKAYAETGSLKDHKLVVGVVASGDQFIANKEKKLEIKNNFDPCCVEMEGAAVAHACYLSDIPFLIIRCMSDMADDDHEKVYDFNEQTAADISSSLVLKMIQYI